MGGLGTGIGGFLDGFVKGAEARRKINKQASDTEIEREDLALRKNADARAAEDLGLRKSADGRAANTDRRAQESHELSLKASQAQLDEYGTNAPVREAERRRRLAEEGNKLGVAEDQSSIRETRRSGMAEAEKEQTELAGKSIMNTTDAEGKPTFTMDGEVYATREQAMARFEAKNGTFLDRFREKVGKSVEAKILETGDVKAAEEWRGYINSSKIGRAIEGIGRAQAGVAAGDWSKAIKHINETAQNGDYVPQVGFSLNLEPVQKDGKTVGARAIFKNPDGTTETKEFSNLGEMGQQFLTMFAPTEMFRHTKTLYEQSNAAKAEMSKENNKTANEILKEQAKSDGTADLKRIEAAIKANEAKYGAADPKEVFSAMEKIGEIDMGRLFKKVGPDGKPVDMTLDERVEKTLALSAGIRARQARAAPMPAGPAGGPGPGAAPQAAPASAAPAQRVLMSRPQVQQQPTPTQLGVPAPRPVVPRSVLPVMTQHPIQGY